jgi:hypothetical protein
VWKVEGGSSGVLAASCGCGRMTIRWMCFSDSTFSFVCVAAAAAAGALLVIDEERLRDLEL